MGPVLYCFNPRARDGRDINPVHYGNDRDVSIHAPVMDAITAPVWGFFWSCFNPRARDGRDLTDYLKQTTIRVSIHAPVMDAISQIIICRHMGRFQSTRP